MVLSSEKLVSKSCDLTLSQEFNSSLVQLLKIIFWFFSDYCKTVRVGDGLVWATIMPYSAYQTGWNAKS